MVTAATGAHGKKLEKLVAMVAATPTFVAQVALEGAADPATQVHHPTRKVNTDNDDPLVIREQVKWPMAIVQNSGEFQWVRQGVSSGPHFRPRGGLLLTLFDRDRNTNDLQDSEMLFTNFWDGVLFDLCQASGLNTNLVISGIECQIAPARSKDRAQEVVSPYWASRYIVRYADA